MRILAVIGALAVIFAVIVGVYVFGGFYNVAANEPDNEYVAKALQRVRIASVERHATGTPPISLDDPAVVRAGAKAFAERGCPTCHGAPGVEWAKFSEGLRPDPPDLKEIVKDLKAAQIFWVVKNGINMTGMPSFGAIGVDDREAWTIAAFVSKLPTVRPEDYKSWSQAQTGAGLGPGR
ncbi:MAG TPA: cytochrome c [Xanthobacteraceae bacterium]|jgi:mono/diheme cytochrome c family protein|nr:cytochrome c [Xanthobacteraceae bacterium]